MIETRAADAAEGYRRFFGANPMRPQTPGLAGVPDGWMEGLPLLAGALGLGLFLDLRQCTVHIGAAPSARQVLGARLAL